MLESSLTYITSTIISYVCLQRCTFVRKIRGHVHCTNLSLPVFFCTSLVTKNIMSRLSALTSTFGIHNYEQQAIPHCLTL